MNKLKMETEDLTLENIEKLKELFPSVVSDGKIDFDKLKQELSADIVKSADSYDFTWVGKHDAVRKANEPVNVVLRPCPEESKNWEKTKNVYIEGDNLDVLKILYKSYAGKIKMIYIDPPYNTGNDFIYNDNFAQSLTEYRDNSHLSDEQGRQLKKLTNSNGKYHSDWCSMMYPRLKIAQKLLSEDGAIFISIDDNEQTNLKKICDEVFGSGNFIATIVRNTNSSKNQSLFVSVSHEYCLIYAKNIEVLKIKHKECKWSVNKNNVNEYIAKVKRLTDAGLTHDEITEELKTLTKYPRFIDFVNYWYFDENGCGKFQNRAGSHRQKARHPGLR